MTSTSPTTASRFKGEEGMIEPPAAGQVLAGSAAFVAGFGAIFGLFVLIALSMGLSVIAVWLSVQTRHEVLGRAKNVEDAAVAITIEHGGDPPRVGARDG